MNSYMLRWKLKDETFKRLGQCRSIAGIMPRPSLRASVA
jgi:hypothetical protein